MRHRIQRVPIRALVDQRTQQTVFLGQQRPGAVELDEAACIEDHL